MKTLFIVLGVVAVIVAIYLLYPIAQKAKNENVQAEAEKIAEDKLSSVARVSTPIVLTEQPQLVYYNRPNNRWFRGRSGTVNVS